MKQTGRQIQPNDAKALFAIFSDEEAMQFYGYEPHRSLDDMANERSKGLLLKLGFTYEGKLRQRYSFRGRFEDEYYFGLLKDEWHGLG